MGVNSATGKGAFAYSLEFEGGTSTNVTFDKDYSIEEIDSEIVPVIEEVTGDHNCTDSESSWNEAGNYQDGNTGSEGKRSAESGDGR